MRPVLTKLSTEQQRVLIAGDLNAPRWSQTARDIATSSRTSSINYRGSSWLPFEFPASWTSWLGLPLDNVFFSGLNILGIKSQAHVGSDHLPLLIEFTIPARDANAEPELLIG